MNHTLTDIIDEWREERDITDGRIAQLQYTASSFARFAGTADASQLDDGQVNRWLLWQSSNGLSPRTVRSNRCNLLTIWKAGFERGYVTEPPQRVRRVRLDNRIPRCWTPEQFETLLSAASEVSGEAQLGIPKRLWLPAMCLVGLSTGLRRGDLLSLEKSFILPGHSVTIVQSKTGDVHTAQFGPRAIAAVEAMPAHSGVLLFPWMHRSDAFTKMFARLLRRLDLPGSFKWIRRSGATWIAQKDGYAAASRYLGHRTPGLARLNYVDPTQVCHDTLIPPGA